MYHTGQRTNIVMVNLINPIYKKDFKEWKQNKTGVTFSNTPLEKTSVEFVSMKLKPFQVLIIPSHWMLQVVEPEEVVKVDLDDIFTYFYFKIVS
jgi:competence transcription factor ComK